MDPYAKANERKVARNDQERGVRSQSTDISNLRYPR
jgi:hypothetical protein